MAAGLVAAEFIQRLLEAHLPPPSAGEVAENKLGKNRGEPKKHPNTKTILVVTHGTHGQILVTLINIGHTGL